MKFRMILFAFIFFNMFAGQFDQAIEMLTNRIDVKAAAQKVWRHQYHSRYVGKTNAKLYAIQQIPSP